MPRWNRRGGPRARIAATKAKGTHFSPRSWAAHMKTARSAAPVAAARYHEPRCDQNQILALRRHGREVRSTPTPWRDEPMLSARLARKARSAEFLRLALS